MKKYYHRRHFGGSTFLLSTPVLPGAVLNKLGGTSSDQPDIGSGNWRKSEYRTPMVAYTLWLWAENLNDCTTMQKRCVACNASPKTTAIKDTGFLKEF